jgi:hypothetical protein
MASQERAQPGQQEEHKTRQSFLSDSKESVVDQPYQVIIRDILWSCKVILLCFIGVSLVWGFTFGQPAKLLNLPLGVYQGFNCGWNSEVENIWTCDK